MRPEDTEAASGEAAQYDQEVDNFAAAGRRLVDLGNAMQDKNTSIDELASLAFKAGVSIAFRIEAADAGLGVESENGESLAARRNWAIGLAQKSRQAMVRRADDARG